MVAVALDKPRYHGAYLFTQMEEITDKEGRLNFIRAKCIVANKDILGTRSAPCFSCGGEPIFETAHNPITGEREYGTCSSCDGRGRIDEEYVRREPTLADVFIAMQKKGYEPKDYCQCGLNGVQGTLLSLWNISADDLARQNQETIGFIYEFLQRSESSLLPKI